MRTKAFFVRDFFGAVAGALFAAGVLMSPATKATTLWIEGEKPARSSMNRHPWWYDQVKRDQFSGGDFLSNFHDTKPGEAEYQFTVPAAGQYTFWVRANPVQAQLAYQLNGGPWAEIDLGKNQSGSTNVATDGKPDLRFIAWIEVGKVALNKGSNRVAFRIHGPKQNHGYLDCFVLTDEPFQPQGILKPGEIVALAQRLAEENKGWFAFLPPAERPKAEGRLDLRWLNQGQAGEDGFIAVQGEHFVYGKTRRPVRFWAVNGPPQELKDREGLDRCARLLARNGVNLVRIHRGYFDETGEVDLAKVREVQRVVAAMKAEGIYSYFSIYFPLWLKPKPGISWLQGYDGNKHPFAALFFNKDFQGQYRKWWKALLLTSDSKTGKRLVDDPAVAGLEILNEDSYFFWTFSPENIPDVQLRILERQFGDWVKGRYGSPDAALQAWKGQKTPRDSLAEGRLGFRPLWNMFNEKSPRDKDAARFLLESQRRFYKETYDFLRGLGFQGAITASNWITASPEAFGPLEKLSYTPGDFIDRHGYFGCQHKGQFAEWSIREGHTYRDRSALRFDPEEPGKPKQFVHPVIDPHYAGKPSMISETTFNRPNRYRSEAPLFYAAYGALQGTGAVVHFALDGASWSVKPGFFMQPWTLMSPAMMGQFPAAALIFRQGMVARGEVLVELNLVVDELLELRGTPMPQDAPLDELRLKDVPRGTTIKPGQVIDPLVHFAGRTSVRFAHQPAAHVLRDLSSCIDHKRQTVTSTTGQLRLNYGKGILLIDAPKAQGASGALRQGGKIELTVLTISSNLELGHIVAVSLDGQSLAESRDILLQVMTEEKPSDFQTQVVGSLRRITNIGQDPWLVKEVHGEVRFKRRDAARLRVVALDHAGYPQKEVGTAAEIHLLPNTLYYRLAP